MLNQAPERPAQIDTPRLVLVVLQPSEIRALISGDTMSASKAAGVVFPPAWPESADAREGLPWHLGYLETDGRHRAWRIRVVVDRGTNAVVGSVNLKGPPDPVGDVEIGWGIADAWRRRGYACEAVSGVIDWIRQQPGAASVTATIADDNVASQGLAQKLGFVRTARLRRERPVWYRSVA
jgi:RimJ/RimL family protein N-acetyltransferase